MIKALLAILLVFSVLMSIDDVKAKKIEISSKTINFDSQLIAYDDDDDWDSEDEELNYIFNAKKDKDKKSKKKKKKKEKKKKIKE